MGYQSPSANWWCRSSCSPQADQAAEASVSNDGVSTESLVSPQSASEASASSSAEEVSNVETESLVLASAESGDDVPEVSASGSSDAMSGVDFLSNVDVVVPEDPASTGPSEGVQDAGTFPMESKAVVETGPSGDAVLSASSLQLDPPGSLLEISEFSSLETLSSSSVSISQFPKTGDETIAVLKPGCSGESSLSGPASSSMRKDKESDALGSLLARGLKRSQSLVSSNKRLAGASSTRPGFHSKLPIVVSARRLQSSN